MLSHRSIVSSKILWKLKKSNKDYFVSLYIFIVSEQDDNLVFPDYDTSLAWDGLSNVQLL